MARCRVTIDNIEGACPRRAERGTHACRRCRKRVLDAMHHTMISQGRGALAVELSELARMRYREVAP